MTIEVRGIQSWETHEWLTHVHYAARIPSISYAFGLFEDGVLMGVCTYGCPSSAPLREGIAGKEYAPIVLELNRLCFVSAKKNWASMLVGRSLAMLPKPSIVVSYADTAQGHIGYVYQSCNFLYTGLSAKRTDWRVKGMEHLHGQTVADISRGCEGSRADFMRDKFGDDFYLEERARKHRYVYICAKKSARSKILSALMYQVEPYPKGDTKRYDISHLPQTQASLF